MIHLFEIPSYDPVKGLVLRLVRVKPYLSTVSGMLLRVRLQKLLQIQLKMTRREGGHFWLGNVSWNSTTVKWNENNWEQTSLRIPLLHKQCMKFLMELIWDDLSCYIHNYKLCFGFISSFIRTQQLVLKEMHTDGQGNSYIPLTLRQCNKAFWGKIVSSYNHAE